VALLSVLTVARFAATREGPGVARATSLAEEASRAFSAQRYAEAAERASRAIGLGVPAEVRAELLCLRGESLLEAGQLQDAAKAFDALLLESPRGPYTAQALYGAVRAKERTGAVAAAAPQRRRLETEFAATPWADRLKADGRP